MRETHGYSPRSLRDGMLSGVWECGHRKSDRQGWHGMAGAHIQTKQNTNAHQSIVHSLRHKIAQVGGGGEKKRMPPCSDHGGPVRLDAPVKILAEAVRDKDQLRKSFFLPVLAQ